MDRFSNTIESYVGLTLLFFRKIIFIFTIFVIILSSKLSICQTHNNLLINKIRAEIIKKDISLLPSEFNPRNFDSHVYDPILIELMWKEVKSVIDSISNRESNIKHQNRCLMYILPISELYVFGERFMYKGRKIKDYTCQRCKLIFVFCDKDYAAIVSEILSIPLDCFVNDPSEWLPKAFLVITGFKQKYICENSLCLSVIASDIGKLINCKKSAFDKYGLESEIAYVKEDKVIVCSKWKFDFKTIKYVYFWRFYFELVKAKPKGWNMITRIDYARKSPSERLLKLKIFEDVSSEIMPVAAINQKPYKYLLDFFGLTLRNTEKNLFKPSEISNKANICRQLHSDFIDLLIEEYK